jgi:hypothetical protein
MWSLPCNANCSRKCVGTGVRRRVYSRLYAHQIGKGDKISTVRDERPIHPGLPRFGFCEIHSASISISISAIVDRNFETVLRMVAESVVERHDSNTVSSLVL